MVVWHQAPKSDFALNIYKEQVLVTRFPIVPFLVLRVLQLLFSFSPLGIAIAYAARTDLQTGDLDTCTNGSLYKYSLNAREIVSWPLLITSSTTFLYSGLTVIYHLLRPQAFHRKHVAAIIAAGDFLGFSANVIVFVLYAVAGGSGIISRDCNCGSTSSEDEDDDDGTEEYGENVKCQLFQGGVFSALVVGFLMFVSMIYALKYMRERRREEVQHGAA
ncbi:hypothetical protein RUND412_001700 [Rhizina undulata]